MILQQITSCLLYNTGSEDVNIEAVSVLSNAHHLNNLVDNSNLECSINGGATGDKVCSQVLY